MLWRARRRLGAPGARNLHDVPIDPHDLPGYAARQFDQHQQYPDVLRLATWHQVERGGRGMQAGAVADAYEHKVRAIEAAQQPGVVPGRLPARTPFDLILALTQTRPQAPDPEDLRVSRRREIAKAVRALFGD